MIKKLSFVILIGVLMVIGTSVAQAQDGGVFTVETDDYGTVVGIDDGRLNAFDQAAPVAIYYTYECVQQTGLTGQPLYDKNGGYVYENPCTGIDILSIDHATGNGSVALHISTDELLDLVATGETSISNNWVTLNLGEDGWLEVTTPADFEGKVYTFSWDDLGRTVPEVQ